MSTTITARPVTGLAEAVVDLAAVRHNVALIRRLRPRVAVMAVVKADGFGHGAVPVARTAVEAGAGWLGVAHGAEALELRAAGLTAPILAWGTITPEVLASGTVDVGVATMAGLDEAAAAPGRPRVHLKLDTGLHRGGAPAGGWPALVRAAARYEARGALAVHGVWSHLSHGDRPAARQTRDQLALLRAGVAAARGAGLNPEVVHLANTAGAVGLDVPDLDLVRIGAGLYGIDELDAGLRPAMRLVATVLQVSRIRAGDSVSSGHDWVAPADTTVGLVGLGFADGVPRIAGPRAGVLCRDRRMALAGRVAMDHLTIDAGDTPIAPGDRVVVFGDGAQGEPTAADWADWSDTIPHEIYCRIGPRVRRRYVDDRAVAR